MIGRPGLRLALVCAAVASLVAAGVARAATLVDFTGQVGPAIRTVPKKPLALSLRITLRLSSDQPGGLPATLDRTTISFPYG
jgi:hypothetical protein